MRRRLIARHRRSRAIRGRWPPDGSQTEPREEPRAVVIEPSSPKPAGRCRRSGANTAVSTASWLRDAGASIDPDELARMVAAVWTRMADQLLGRRWRTGRAHPPRGSRRTAARSRSGRRTPDAQAAMPASGGSLERPIPRFAGHSFPPRRRAPGSLPGVGSGAGTPCAISNARATRLVTGPWPGVGRTYRASERIGRRIVVTLDRHLASNGAPDTAPAPTRTSMTSTSIIQRSESSSRHWPSV